MSREESSDKFDPKARRKARKAARERAKVDQGIIDLVDPLARKIGVYNYKKATGYTVRRDRVHIDHETGGVWNDCSEFYARAWANGLAAVQEWDGHRLGGMSLESFVLWRMYRSGNDTSWWRAGTTMPKNVIYPYLATAELNDDPNARRLAWIDMGYEGWKFDQVHGIVNWAQTTIAGTDDFLDDETGEPIPQDRPAQGGNVVDPEFETQLRLFETEDLSEVQQLVYRFRSWGYSNAEVDDMIPDALLPKAPSPVTRAKEVSEIHAEACRKRARFFDYLDGSDS